MSDNYPRYIPEGNDVKGRPPQRPGQEQVNKIYNLLIKSREYWVIHFHEGFNPEPICEYLYLHYFKATKDEWDCVAFTFDEPGENGIRLVMFYKKSRITAMQLNQALAECYDAPYERAQFDEAHDISYIGHREDSRFTKAPISDRIKQK